jgi:hypothetical protein
VTLLISVLTYTRFVKLVIRDITTYLGIVCFKVLEKNPGGEWVDVVPEKASEAKKRSMWDVRGCTWALFRVMMGEFDVGGIWDKGRLICLILIFSSEAENSPGINKHNEFHSGTYMYVYLYFWTSFILLYGINSVREVYTYIQVAK